MNKTVNINIDGKEVMADPNGTVLQAALEAGIYVPNLCWHKDLPSIGACRMCIVEIDGMRGYPASCVTKPAPGMVVRTDTPKLRELRQNTLWLLLSDHPETVIEGTQFEKIIEKVGLKKQMPHLMHKSRGMGLKLEDPLFIRDMDRCILCGRCVRICQEIRGVGAIGIMNRGIKSFVGTPRDVELKQSECRFCTACVEVCPTGAIRDKFMVDPENNWMIRESAPRGIQREKKLVPCVDACPGGVDIPRYARYTALGRFQDALEVIREKAPFPWTLGLVCDHPCETACRRQEVNQPISIRAIKRFVAEKDNLRWKEKCKPLPETGKKVAIVGGGPAGLTAAWFLRLKGHEVTVFEEAPKAGGMLRLGIPPYRLYDQVIDTEIGHITDIGVQIKTSVKIENTKELLDQGFDAILLSVGAKKGMAMGISGQDDKRVMDGISFLSKLNLGQDTGIRGRVIVAGGGNVAIDCARSALRLGCQVSLVYRRGKEEMPAAIEEIHEAEIEGINMLYLMNPIAIYPKEKQLDIECIKMELGPPDASGRRSPEPIKGSENILPADYFIMAIGQQPLINPEMGVIQDRKKLIVADPNNMNTENPRIWAAGDVVTGPKNVITAISCGSKAASSIDKFLGGDGIINRPIAPDDPADEKIGRIEGFADFKRAILNTVPVEKRLGGFDQVDLNMTEEEALFEGNRCLQCQLRLGITDCSCLGLT